MLLFINLRKTIPLFALVCAAAVAVEAQPAKIKPEPLPYTSPTKGIEMFAVYCAPCHGVAGKGNGPAASALKAPLPDLTMLKAKNNGKFPEAAVYTAIRGDANAPIPAHGSPTMPVYGKIFLSTSGEDVANAQLRLANLVAYIKSIQK
jgi:mono/diheme cytochrome c family protein